MLSKEATLAEVIDVLNSLSEPCVVADDGFASYEEYKQALKDHSGMSPIQRGPAPGRSPEDLHPSLRAPDITMAKLKADVETMMNTKACTTDFDQPTKEERAKQLAKVLEAHHQWIRCVVFEYAGEDEAGAKYLRERDRLEQML